MGEMIKVDRLVLGRGGLGDQLVGRDIVERETLFDHGVELVALAWQHFAVDRRGVHQHGGGRQPVIVLGELIGMFLAVGEFGNEAFERFEHEIFRLPAGFSATSIPRSYRDVKRKGQGSVRA